MAGKTNFTRGLTFSTRLLYPVGFTVFLVAVFSIVGAPILNMWRAMPEELDDVTIGQRNIMLDVNGNVFAQTWVEDRKILQDIDEVSIHARNALIATEDNRFYYNDGFDVQGTIRAAVTGQGGGSGITQQLVKNLQYYDIIGNSKESATAATLDRKIRELKLAINYEKNHTKDEILLNYFNTISFGSPNTYSIENAANYFFGKNAKDLNIAESSVLIGSIQNPSIYDLRSEEVETWDNIKNRQKVVLDSMLRDGYITREEHDIAFNEQLNLVMDRENGGNCTTSPYPFYCEYVLDYISKSPRYGESEDERKDLISKGGLIIKTHLDPEAMKIADEQLERDYGNTNRIVVPTALVKPGTGGVSAIAVNREYGTGEGETTINLPLVPKATGSAFKPVTLGAAINAGYNRSSLTFSSACPLYTPGYDMPPGGFRNSNSCELQGGTLDHKQATAYSSNTWYVTLEKNIGVNTVKEFAASIGLEAPDYIGERSLSYTLGTTEHSPVDMAAAFATFSNEGIYCPPTPIMNVSYEDNTSPIVPDTYDDSIDSCRSVISPMGASIVLEAMRANVSGEIPDAFGTKHALPNYDSAGKSGTNELQNSTWVQQTGNYVIFSNMYDPVSTNAGIDGVYYKGGYSRWYDHTVANTGRDILNQVINLKGYEPLNYNATSTEKKPNLINQEDLFTVPSVIGATEKEALKVFEELGIVAKVEKEEQPSPNSKYPENIIIHQSVEPGTRLAVGTDREIILTTN